MKFHSKLFFVFLMFLLFPCAPAIAQGNTHDMAIPLANDSLQLLQLPQTTFFRRVYTAPALMPFSPYGFNHGELDISSKYDDRKDFHTLKEGTSAQIYSFQSNGVRRLGNKMFWGEASYNNFNIYNTVWNSSAESDEMLGPYIVADSIGGDFSGEKYTVKGGFAVESGRWSYGAQAGYSASHSYRKVDPRPKSTVTDIFIDAGVSRQINKSYILGVSAEISNYRNNLGISVVQSQTNYDFFVMQGFGMFHRQLSEKASNFSWRYSGLGYGGELTLIPTGNGLLAKAKIRAHNTESDKGNNYKPFRYSILTSENSLGWQRVSTDTKLFFRADYEYSRGTGTENTYKYEMVNEIFGQYVLLSSSDMYFCENHKATFSACVQRATSNNSYYWAEAEVGYNFYEERYELPKYWMSFSRLNSSLKLGYLVNLKQKSSLQLGLRLDYSPMLNSKNQLPENDTIFDLSIRPDTTIRQADILTISPVIAYMVDIGKGLKLKLSATGNYAHINNRGNIFSAVTSIGITF